MKKCPTCSQTYSDDNLSFCLSDGSILQQLSQSADRHDPPPTVVMDYPRPTNEYAAQNQPYTPPYSPMDAWQGGNPPMMQSPAYVSQDQTLPIISLVLGLLGLTSFCCSFSVIFSIAAVITGFIGMQNANKDPMQYSGKGMAIAGLITGGAGLLVTVGLVIFWLFLAAVG